MEDPTEVGWLLAHTLQKWRFVHCLQGRSESAVIILWRFLWWDRVAGAQLFLAVTTSFSVCSSFRLLPVWMDGHTNATTRYRIDSFTYTSAQALPRDSTEIAEHPGLPRFLSKFRNIYLPYHSALQQMAVNWSDHSPMVFFPDIITSTPSTSE